MGYPTVANFDKNIIFRTRENLVNSSVKNDLTHLLNCLFGLIIVPNQMIVQGRRHLAFFERKISDYQFLDFLRTEDTFVDEDKDGKFVEFKASKLIHKHINYNDIKIAEFLDRIRNGIAHNGIRPTKEETSWRGVIIRSYSRDRQVPAWSDNYDFQLFLTQDELKQLCLFLTAEYLKELN